MNAAWCVSFLSAMYQFSGRLTQAGLITPICNWEIRTDQLVDVFVNYSNANPQKRTLMASDFALAAIIESFRCEETDWQKQE